MNISRRIFTFAVTCVFSSSALAGAKPTLIVPPMPGISNGRARESIIQAFRASGRVAVVDQAAVDRFLGGKESAQARKGTAEASALLAKGQEVYKELKVKEAIDLFVKAKLEFRDKLNEENAFDGLRASQFYLSMAYLAIGDVGRAHTELREVIILDPDRDTRKLSPKLYSPKVRAMYDEVRKEIKKKEKGNLDIRSDVEGAIAYVDGKSVGTTPTQAKDLPVGEHFIRLVAEGAPPDLQTKFIVAGENRIEFEAKPKPVVDPMAMFSTVSDSSSIEQPRAAFLDEMGLALGGDIFVFLKPSAAAVEAQLYDQRSQEVSPIESDRSPEGLVKKLLRHLDDSGYVAPAANKKSAPPETVAAKNPPSEIPQNLQPKSEGTLSDQAKQPLNRPNPAKESLFWFENPKVWAIIGGVVLVVGGSILLFTDVAKSNASSSTLTVTLP